MTRGQQFEIFAGGFLVGGSVVATPYAKFLAAGTSEAKNAWEDPSKSVAITKKALDADGRAEVFGDGIYKIQIYAGDPDAGGVLKFTIDNYKVTAVTGDARTITQDTVGTVDDGLVIADTTSQHVAYTLPSAVPMIGRTLTLKKKVSENVLSYLAPDGETIDGQASGSLTDGNATIQFLSDGANWYGAQIVGTAETLGGFAPSVDADASTIPVRDVNGDIAGVATYAEIDVVLGGDFSTTAKLFANGRMRTLFVPVSTHTSKSQPVSAAGAIPVGHRPAATVLNVYGLLDGVRQVSVGSAGGVSFHYVNWSGVPTASTTTDFAASVSWWV